MRRLLLCFSLVFAFAGMCTGAATESVEEEKSVEAGPADSKDPVVVPVEGTDEEYWCCEYKDDDDVKQYALVEGPGECNTKYAKQDGRYVSGNQCIPCCCETPKDPDDLEQGYAHERTTPKTCVAAGGECKPSASIEACGGEAPEEEAAGKGDARPAPRIIDNPRPALRPGRDRR